MLVTSLLASKLLFSRLLHYQHHLTTTSSIDNPEFFLSPEGKSDPEAEWAADARVLAQDKMAFDGREVDPQCLFPARALVLRQAGALPREKRPCPEYEAFREKIALESMTVIFSTAYVGNSASMFGHTFLKLNSAKSKASGGLLDYGVAFLAKNDPNDGAMYAVKGLFGGYPGFYTVQPYYELVNQYAFNENRDLWEFQIPIDPDRREVFVAHLWELMQNARADYYFSHVNCAAMLAELIDVAEPEWGLRESMRGFVMPSEVVRQAVTRNGASREAKFRPSQRRRWIASVAKLDGLERLAYERDWSRRDVSGETDAIVLDALLDRLTYEKGRLTLDEQGPLREFESKVLVRRSEFPATTAAEVPDPGNNPALEHAPHAVGVRAGGYDKQAMYGLKLKAGWHDLLDDARGFEPYYQLNFFDLSLDASTKTRPALVAGDLKVAEVWSLNPWQANDHAISWSLGGGELYEDKTNAAYFRGSVGLSTGMGRVLLSVLPGAEVRDNFSLGRLELMGFVDAQALVRWMPTLRSLVRVEPQMFTYGRQYVESWVETRWDVSHEDQLQAVFKRSYDVSRWSLGYTRFF